MHKYKQLVADLRERAAGAEFTARFTMHMAADAIERLTAEVNRLNNENFWLSKNGQSPTGRRLMEVPPVNRGDKVWTIKRNGGGLFVACAPITRMEIDGDKVYITVRGGGSGYYGEQIFGSSEEAAEALARIQAKTREESQ